MSMKPSAIYANRLQRYPDEIWLIWSNKWSCWYRADSCGYTNDVLAAGLYTREQAAQHYSTGPRKLRDTEPFPLSSVRHMMTRDVAIIRARLAEAESRVALLNYRKPIPPHPSPESLGG